MDSAAIVISKDVKTHQIPPFPGYRCFIRGFHCTRTTFYQIQKTEKNQHRQTLNPPLTLLCPGAKGLSISKLNSSPRLKTHIKTKTPSQFNLLFFCKKIGEKLGNERISLLGCSHYSDQSMPLRPPDNTQDEEYFRNKNSGVVRDITERDHAPQPGGGGGGGGAGGGQTGAQGGPSKKKKMNHQVLLGIVDSTFHVLKTSV